VKPHEIYQHLDPALVQDMFLYFRENERDLYKSAVASLASNRKLRPVFIQKKPAVDQITWLHKTLKLRSSDVIGEHLFQAWFMKSQQPLLIDFCDGMQIPHNGEGTVEGELPGDLDADKLKATLDILVEKHNPKLVTLYLRVFNLQTATGWPTLATALAEDERLVLG
jgi:hypothetical protein